MPIVRTAEELETVEGDGYAVTACAGADVFGAPVPMRGRRVVVQPGATAPIDLAGDEAMVYVVAGSGTLDTDTEAHELGPESMVWLEPPATASVRAGADGIEVLVTEAPGR